MFFSFVLICLTTWVNISKISFLNFLQNVDMNLGSRVYPFFFITTQYWFVHTVAKKSGGMQTSILT